MEYNLSIFWEYLRIFQVLDKCYVKREYNLSIFWEYLGIFQVLDKCC